MTTGPRNSLRRPRTARTAARRRRGFTLMELILVMVIVSAVLGLSAPSLRGFFASRQTADAAATMLSLTKLARSQAVAQANLCRLNIDPQARTYWLTVQQAGAHVTLGSEMGRCFQLPEGATVSLQSDSLDPAESYVQFYPTGRCDVATIEVRGRQGDVYLITCPSATEPFRVLRPWEVP